VCNGDAIIGKVVSTSRMQACAGVGEKRRDMQRDRSTILRTDEAAVVDAVFRSKTTEGNGFVRIRTRSMRIPGVGDKLSSRHGQKGIIGSVLADSDMPFTSSGIVPDLIVNPHAIPSRMTIGQIVECLVGKLGCATAQIMDGTPFRDTSIEAIADELERLGYQRSGNEQMYNGMTGERMPCLIFIGPTFYQRLKHMVTDKCHGRGRGPVQLLCRQPVEGRSREGGLRCGEMERDCFIAHGATSVLRDRLFEQADPFSTSVCAKCGLLCQPAVEAPGGAGVGVGGAGAGVVVGDVAMCRNCMTSDCREMQMPYAFKLLTHELYGMCIAPRMRFVAE
jgi:DNA-directed RNA polymerase II subunit RPB2